MVGRKEASKIEKNSRNSLQRSKSSSTTTNFLRFFGLAKKMGNLGFVPLGFFFA
jgi:hypothetical protein